jgi:uracil-DNA glycosylase
MAVTMKSLRTINARMYENVKPKLTETRVYRFFKDPGQDDLTNTEPPTINVIMELKKTRLDNLASQVSGCMLCRLAATRSQTVFGEGNPDARVMFIGEGPGSREDQTGRPFVGRAGELLTRIIESGMGISRGDVYIANIVKCRPTVDQHMQRDRPPDPDEVASCSPYLLKQIEIIRPEVIVALGSPSAKFLLKTGTGITKLRGTWGEFNGIQVMPTFHPSYLLRNGGETSPLRREVWEDIRQVMQLLGLPLPPNKKEVHDESD